MKRSVQSALCDKTFKIMSVKKLFTSNLAHLRKIEKIKKKGKYTYSLPILKLNKNVKVQSFSGMMYYVINQEICENPNKVIYFHGGAFINQPSIFHWRLIRKIALETKAEIWVPIYPKIPLSNAENAYNVLINLYSMYVNQYPKHDFILVGDSAGGGLVLGLAQEIRKLQLKQPKELIMISPWLDLSMTNPEITKIAPFDFQLDPEGLRLCGLLWAGKLPVTAPIVSPLFGDLTNLGNLTLFTGTHDILCADARSLEKKAQESGVDLNYYEYEALGHDFPLLPIPEAKVVINKIIDIINR